jgi:hypothetical protein
MGEGQVILAALRQSLEGRHKAAACAIYPGASVEQAQSRLSRVLSGDLALPPALLSWVLASDRPEPLLDCLVGLAGARWEPVPEAAGQLRERVARKLDVVAEQLELLRADLGEADRLDEMEARRGPVRVRRTRERGEESA